MHTPTVIGLECDYCIMSKIMNNKNVHIFSQALHQECAVGNMTMFKRLNLHTQAYSIMNLTYFVGFDFNTATILHVNISDSAMIATPCCIVSSTIKYEREKKINQC